MDYSEIKVIFKNYSNEMKANAGSIEFTKKPALKALRENEFAFSILSAYTDQTTYQDEFFSMVDAIDIFLQIYNVVGDVNQAAEILYKMIVDNELDINIEKNRNIYENYIKTIFENYGNEIKSIAGIIDSTKRPATKTLEKNEFAHSILLAFTNQTTYQNKFLSMIDAIDIFLQIYNVVGDVDQSAELLYKIIVDDEIDVITERYRAIHENYINEIFVNEIKDDSYKLGSFSADLIAEATGWPFELIKAAQKGESFSEIGDAMTIEQIKKLVEIHVRSDGYAYHFARYDSQTHDIRKDDLGYYLFRIN